MTLLRPLLFAAAAGLALSACTAPPPEPAGTLAPAEAAASAPAEEPAAPPMDTVDAEETTMTCDDTKGQWALGQVADEALVARVVADTGSERWRVIPPDTAVTMDYREDRVNIEVDADNVVIAVRCG